MEIQEDKLVLGEKQYSQEELNELLEFGSKYKEFETKYDTNPDKAWSAYGKVTSENKDLRDKAARVEELEGKLAEFEKRGKQNIEGDTELTDAQIAEARKAAQKIGILTEDGLDKLLEDRGFVRKSDVDNAFKSREIMSQFDTLSGKYDGKNGLPKFDQDEMVAYMERTRITDPEIAYNAKFADQIAEYRANKILEEKYPQIVTSKRGAEDKQPKKERVTSENLRDKLMEKFSSAEF